MQEYGGSNLARGWFLYGQRRFEAALRDALEVLAQDPRASTAHALASWCLTGLGRFDEAEASARRAIECEPNDVNGWSSLAGCFLWQNRDREALEASDVAIALQPQEAGLREQHARILFVGGRSADALREALAALELAPLDADLHELRALVSKELLADAEAQRACEDLLAADAERPRGHTLRGWLALRRGEPDKARDAFGEALRLDPADDDARDGLVELLQQGHPVLRWFARKPQASSGRETKKSAEQDERELKHTQNWMLASGAISGLFLAYKLGRFLTGHAHWSGWLAWPSSGLAGLVGGIATGLASAFAFELVKVLCVELVDLTRSLLRFAVIGPIGDVMLATTRAGRHALTKARLRRAAWMAALLVVLSSGIGLAIALDAFAWVRLASGLVWFVPLFAWPWPGDIRTLRIGLCAVVALGCAGLFLGAWSLVGAAVFLAALTLFALSPGPSCERKLQKLTFWVTWIAVGTCLASRVASGAPSLAWVLALAALGGVTSFVGVCFAARSASQRTNGSGAPAAAPQARRAA